VSLHSLPEVGQELVFVPWHEVGEDIDPALAHFNVGGEIRRIL
jgi:hypothetical protein